MTISPTTEPAVSEIPYATLSDQASGIRERINRFRTALGRFFVGKQRIIDVMTVGAIAQEPVLLVGPPGTAKSELVVKFRDALGIPDTAYFEYMLTRFSEPSEILGPIDINELRDGRYIRREKGKLPTAQIAFLDEIFKSNSAILNVLLTIINERKFYQDGVAVPVPLKILFAATNEIPEHAELRALNDRFVLKVPCRSVQDDHFEELIDAGLESVVAKDLRQRPWAEGHATLDDMLRAHRYLTLTFGKKYTGTNGEPQRDRHLFFKDSLFKEFRRVVKTLAREDGVFISDRKLVKIYKLLRAHAWLMHGGVVERQDLALLAYLGETHEELELLEEKVPRLLGEG